MHDQQKDQATLGQLFTVNNGLYSYSESTPIPYLFVIEAFFEIGQIKTPKKLDFSQFYCLALFRGTHLDIYKSQSVNM